MAFRITGLDPAPFLPLYGLSNEALARRGVRRMTVDAPVGFPDRVELRDLDPGESVLLLNHLHQPADTPYRASHAIFVREGAERAAALSNEVPPVMHRRMLSLRAFDAEGDMRAAELAQGDDIAPALERLLAAEGVAYLHAHYAARGCYAARVERG